MPWGSTDDLQWERKRANIVTRALNSIQGVLLRGSDNKDASKIFEIISICKEANSRIRLNKEVYYHK